MEHIVILGGGFGGVAAALAVHREITMSGRDDVDCLLVDRHDYHTYNGALYEVATAVLPEHAPEGCIGVLKNTDCVPHNVIFAGKRGVTSIRGQITRVDPERRFVELEDGQKFEYDCLVTALGSETDDFGIPGVREYAFGLKSVRDAIAIRCHVEEMFHDAHRDLAKAEGEGNLRFVIAGGGFSGCEFAGELLNYCRVLAREHRVPYERVSVQIVEAKDQLLPGMPDRVSVTISRRLMSLGVVITFGRSVRNVTADAVELDSRERIRTKTLIWTAGIRANSLVRTLGLPVDGKGRLVVNAYLQSIADPRVFGIGDAAAIRDPKTGQSIPGLAYFAIQAGHTVARNAIRFLDGHPLDTFTPVFKGYVIPVHGKYALAVIGRRTITGFLGWVIRRFVDFRYFLTILPFPKALKLWWSATRMFVRND